MPACPKSRRRQCIERAMKIFFQLHSEQPSCADHHVGIAGKVEEKLEPKSDPKQQNIKPTPTALHLVKSSGYSTTGTKPRCQNLRQDHFHNHTLEHAPCSHRNIRQVKSREAAKLWQH